MLFQEIDWTRILPVFFSQLFIALVFLYLSYKLLRRHRTRISLICTMIYVPMTCAFFINIVYLFLRINPTVFILYLIAIYMLLLAQIFLLIFNLNLLKSKFEFTLKKQIIYFAIYAIGFFVVLLLPNGMKIDESTNWRPIWSLYFSIILVVLVTIFFFIPTSYFSIKIYNSFEDKIIKKKWAYYLIGYGGLIFTFYSMTIYNTNLDPIIRLITSLLTLILIPSGILMYLGIGRQLQK